MLCTPLPPQSQERNGRVNLMVENGTPLFMQDKVMCNDKALYYNSMKYTFQHTSLSKLFFSSENTAIIENSIKAGVYQVSQQKYIIDKQSPDDLHIIMRATFIQHALHQPDQITKQIEILNSRVVNHCVPKIYGEILSLLKYRQDASTLVVPIDRPVFEENRKVTLERKKFI